VTEISLRSGGVRVRPDRLPGHDPQAGPDTEVVPVSGGADYSSSAPRLQLRRPGEDPSAERVGRPQPVLEPTQVLRRKEEVQPATGHPSRNDFLITVVTK